MADKIMMVTDEDVKALREAREMLSDLGIAAIKDMMTGTNTDEEKAVVMAVIESVERTGMVLTKFIGDEKEILRDVGDLLTKLSAMLN